MESVTRFLRAGLKVNEAKSAVDQTVAADVSGLYIYRWTQTAGER